LTGNQNPVVIGHMKIKMIGLTVAFCVLAEGVCFAANPQMGTWKLNEKKSKLAAGTVKNTMVVYESMLGKVKCTVDGTDAKGKPINSEWTGKFDGKDYPVTGYPDSDACSFTKVNDRTMDYTIKNHGKVTVAGHIVVAPDGKSRTVTTTGTNPKGKKFKSVAVYDKA
jgi:hypothetical protein